MICSIHHTPKPIATKILEDAFQKRQRLLNFELTDNAGPEFLEWLPLPIAVEQTLALMPFVRGFKVFRFFFTYLYLLGTPKR